jgi:hypothetical protein
MDTHTGEILFSHNTEQMTPLEKVYLIFKGRKRIGGWLRSMDFGLGTRNLGEC